MRKLWLLLAATLAACSIRNDAPAPQPLSQPGPATRWEAISVVATPVPLNAPRYEGQGAVRFAGGVVLTSADTTRFRGLSDIKFMPDGSVLMISDEGDLFRARLTLDAGGRLVGMSEVGMRPLTGLQGERLQGKDWGDAEGLAVFGDGSFLVTFEQNHRAWRYSDPAHPPLAQPMPDAVLAPNDGLEGLTAGRDNSWWAGGEQGGFWHCNARTGCEAIQPAPQVGDFKTTSLQMDPDGDGIYVLGRAFDPVRGARAQVTFWRAPGGITRGGQFDEVLELAAPAAVDNFEGLAVVYEGGRARRLYLLSDDNFSDRQRTLLLAFDLK